MTRLEFVTDVVTNGNGLDDEYSRWLLARVQDLTAALKDVEWAGDFCDGPACPLCLSSPWPIRKVMHNGTCPLAGVLQALGEDGAEERAPERATPEPNTNSRVDRAERRRENLGCPICPPNRNENAKRKPKPDRKKNPRRR